MPLPEPLTDLGLSALASAYAAGATTPAALIKALYPALEALDNAFVVVVPLDALLARAQELEGTQPEARGQLWGVPFAVKDNVDVAGLPTTAACPAFEYTPSASAPAVEALLAAGKEQLRLLLSGAGRLDIWQENDYLLTVCVQLG